MRIGIDISQVVYEGTGVARYVREMVKNLVRIDPMNTYVLFGSSLRQQSKLQDFCLEIKEMNPHIEYIIYPFPPSLLDFLWNKLHIIPITWLCGPLDVFWSSDWTQPPLGKAKGITTIHDLSFLRFPELHQAVGKVINRRLDRAKKECCHFFVDSEATQHDVEVLLKINHSSLSVVYPGYSPNP